MLVFFRGAYELSKSMSLALGRSNIWVTLNVELEWGSKPVTDTRTTGSHSPHELQCPVLKSIFFRERSWRESSSGSPHFSTSLEPSTCVQWGTISHPLPDPGSTLQWLCSDTLLLSSYKILFPLLQYVCWICSFLIHLFNQQTFFELTLSARHSLS